jgi:hypothetical protein
VGGGVACVVAGAMRSNYGFNAQCCALTGISFDLCLLLQDKVRAPLATLLPTATSVKDGMDFKFQISKGKKGVSYNVGGQG